MYEDKEIACKECGKAFMFTARDQEFYAEKTDERTGQPFVPPKRCRQCRMNKKQRFPNG